MKSFVRVPPAIRLVICLAALAGAVLVRIQVSRWAENAVTLAIAEAASWNPEKEALKKLTVVLDAGHGGQDGGTAGNGVQEKDATLDLTRRVERKLHELGVKVRLTRADDVYMELEERCAMIASAGGAVFVSIHLNATTVRGVSGIETYFCSQRARLRPGEFSGSEDHRSEWLADLIQRRACRATGAADRGVRDSRLYVVQHAMCPSVLVECGYLTHAEEARRLKRDDYKNKLAAAIAESVRHYLIATSLNPRRGFGPRPSGHDVAAGGP